jgi:bidirectional [NiFe] hydrogenase diaphorase subunit
MTIADEVETGTGGHPSGDPRFELLDKKLRRSKYDQSELIEILHAAQDVFGHLAADVLLYIARALKLPHSRVFGTASFYHLFVFEPQGAHGCTVCMGTACYVKGADQVVDRVSGAFGVGPGETTDDRQFTLATARCLGSCGLAPVVVIDGVVLGHQTPASTLEAVQARLAGGGI